MVRVKRSIESHISKDLKEKSVLISGPRQSGKTTLSKQLNLQYEYLNYDASEDRKLIAQREWNRQVELIIFDELHKMKKWKSWIKGLYDKEPPPPALLVTGSARLDTYRRGGDSLAGRHFMYRLHPFSVREVLPEFSSEEALDRILKFGGFPEPFLKNAPQFASRWRRRHLDTILREDLIDLERVREIKSVEILVDLLRRRVGASTSYASLATDLQVSIHTVKHWIQILQSLYVIFRVTPYHKNIARSLVKESKYYFYDTGTVDGDSGAKLENTVACALIKELHYHEDTTGNRVALHYLRDKEKREVDFLSLIENKPRDLIEVKYGDTNFSRTLFHYQKYFPTANCKQVVYELPRAKTKNGVHMERASKFLAKLSYTH